MGHAATAPHWRAAGQGDTKLAAGPTFPLRCRNCEVTFARDRVSRPSPRRTVGVTAMKPRWTIGPLICLKGIAGLLLIVRQGFLKRGCLAHDLFELSGF